VSGLLLFLPHPDTKINADAMRKIENNDNTLTFGIFSSRDYFFQVPLNLPL
jgi:hypothetical protein